MKAFVTFLESINIGINKAKLEKKNHDCIAKLLEELNADLQHHSHNFRLLAKEIKKQEIQINDLDIGKCRADTSTSLQLCHRFGIETYFKVATLQYPPAGFPCTLKFEDTEYSCDDLHELRIALGVLLSSASFGWALMNALKS